MSKNDKRETLNEEKYMKKTTSEVQVFFKTFIIALIAFLIIITPVTAFLRALESNPGGENAPILADEMEMDVLLDENSPFFDAFTNSKKVNILLLGVNGGLTDTIMLTSLDMKNKHIDLISIPRDTYYQRAGYNGEAQRKINAAYRKNPVNTAKAVSEILMGIPINYYIVMDYESVAKVVDTMGGVPMNIPFHMKYSDPYDKPPLYINLSKGEHVLDGKQAIQFLRFRQGDKGYPGYPDADIGRIKAQQTFMINAFKKCISFDLPKIATTIYDNITSDMKLKTVLYIAQKGIGITGDDITTYTMPGNADPDSPFYVYPKAEEIAEMLTEIYSIAKPDGETSEVEE